MLQEKTATMNGATLNIIDVRDDGVDAAELKRWARAVGWEKILNKSSTTWRSLGDAEKDGLNEKRALALLAEHPTLIKRPVIDVDGEIYIGWRKDTQDAVLG